VLPSAAAITTVRRNPVIRLTRLPSAITALLPAALPAPGSAAGPSVSATSSIGGGACSVGGGPEADWPSAGTPAAGPAGAVRRACSL